MFKTLTAWFTLAVLTLSIGASTIVTITFELERERIAKEECREREIENSCCKGSCVLNERLQSVEGDHDPSTSSPERVLPEILLVFVQPESSEPRSFASLDCAAFGSYPAGTPLAGFHRVFPQPPQFSAA